MQREEKNLLETLLDQNDKFHGIEYQGHHSNDLALALVALSDLGGTIRFFFSIIWNKRSQVELQG